MRDKPDNAASEDSEDSIEEMMQHLGDAKEKRQASKRRDQYIEDLRQEWPDWFVNQNPEAWGAEWRTTSSNTYMHVTRDDWTVGYTFDGDENLKTSDLCVYWVFRVKEDSLKDREIDYDLTAIGENDDLLSSFQDSFYTMETQKEVEKTLSKLNTHSRKGVQSCDWRKDRTYKELVTGTQEFKKDDLDSFEETVVEVFEDLHPIFNLVTESMPE
jgi:hypothetical protein